MSAAPRTLFLAALLAVGLLSACDLSEQNYDYTPGESLDIEGPTEVVVPDTAAYFVRAFTIDKEYTWTVNGEAPLDLRRDGEYIDVVFDDTGTYTIEVTATGGGDPDYSGTLEVTALEPEGEE